MRIISVLIAMLMILASVLSSAGCSENPGSQADSSDNTTNEITETDTMETTTEAETETVTDAPEPEVPKKVELYQLAPESSSLMMSYVVVTPERKIIVIDGGIYGTGFNAKPYLPAAIRAILGLSEGDYFEVEAWFLSHIHSDHYYELAKMLDSYKTEDNYKINNFYFDFPECGVEWNSKQNGDYEPAEHSKLIRGFQNYYSTVGFSGISGADIPEDKWTAPEGDDKYYYNLINGAVITEEAIDKGLSIDVDGVKFRVLLTWCMDSANINDTSIIIRMEYGDHSVLFTGDCGSQESDRLLDKYGAEQLKSEYVQMGHHGQGGPNEKFYKAIDIENSIRLWPTPLWVWNDAKTYAIGATRTWAGLPFEANDFRKQGFLTAGKDFVASLYKRYPGAKSFSVEKWTPQILETQRVAVFELEK